jgi:folate-dependent phosphoribosylglycinamide formyltransferase PurN
MKVVLLTSDSLRHKFIASELSKQLDLQLIVIEAKSDKIQDTSGLNREDAEFISAHFEARNKSELFFFGRHKDFPKEIPKLRVPHGEINSTLVSDTIDKKAPENIVLFGTSIIKEPLLSKYSGKIINLHLGLSPYYKGSGTNLFPFYHNQPECVGATIHLATAKVDQGSILQQLRPNIDVKDDLHSIGNKTILKAGQILPKILIEFKKGNIIPQIQATTGRLCMVKDLTPTVLRTVYKNFEKDMIIEYLQCKKIRDSEKPIFEVRI